jgi:hypothetical protein
MDVAYELPILMIVWQNLAITCSNFYAGFVAIDNRPRCDRLFE